MYPMLYSADDIRETYDDNGISILSDAISCVITEEKNGAFELVLKYPQNGKDYDLIQNDCLIKAKCDNNSNRQLQLFRIYKNAKTESGVTTFYAEHISYVLSGYAVKPFSSPSTTIAEYALQNLYANSVILKDGMRSFWKFESDVLGSFNFNVTVPISVRAGMIEAQPSILDTFGGTYEWDNFTIRLLQNRGEDKGVVLAYGKNIKTIENDMAIDEVYTHIYPYAQYTDDNGNANIVLIEGQILECENSPLYEKKRVKIVDLTDRCIHEGYFNPTSLKKIAEWYIKKYRIDVPKLSITTSFINLADSVDYPMREKLDNVNLCDIVTIYYPLLGINTKEQVTRYVYDMLQERAIEITIGENKTLEPLLRRV